MPLQPLTLSTEVANATVTVQAAGEIDMATTELLEYMTSHALARKGIDRLRLDLSECTFIDSFGIQALVELQRAATRTTCRSSSSPPPSDACACSRLPNSTSCLRSGSSINPASQLAVEAWAGRGTRWAVHLGASSDGDRFTSLGDHVHDGDDRRSAPPFEDRTPDVGSLNLRSQAGQIAHEPRPTRSVAITRERCC